MSPEERKEKLITIKVKESTYRELIKSQAAAVLQTGEKLSMDRVIRGLLGQAPEFQVKIRQEDRH